MSGRHPIRVGRRTFEVSNLQKVLFPDDGITKGELIEYYTRVAQPTAQLLKAGPTSC